MLSRSFYLHPDVMFLARELLGKTLCTRIDGKRTSGMITETEAYAGVTDKASHAFGGRRTKRTEVMYHRGGTAYIYLCYGMYSLFNVVTNEEGIPHAILIRGIIPLEGIDVMKKRRRIDKIGKGFSNGPGKVAEALGIHFSHTGTDLAEIPSDPMKPAIWIEEVTQKPSPEHILSTPRIGVGYSGEDAKLPYRFLLKKK
ncbi:MAG: DNA-3-methyladenine glycosylase [Bacteroidetes bacterium]|nr:MAG: DNA-3-methyladenine glycosylase [Bacteroidota bacterium]